jgi:hypothetical protein
MTEQHYSETERPDRPTQINQHLRKRQEHSETQRARHKLAAAVREITNLQAMIADLERGLLMLQVNIDDVLESTAARDPHQSGYPIAARTLVSRRDNLSSTMAILAKRLAELTMTVGKVDRLA